MRKQTFMGYPDRFFVFLNQSTMQYNPYLQKALNTAAKWHEGQKRKGIKYPYIVHPVAVAIILSKYSDDCNLLAAGFLHDILEDVKGYGREEINRDFNNEVLRIVEEVTEEKTPGMSKAEERRTWKARKTKYLRKLEGDSVEGLMVCAADKIHNLHSLLEFYAQKRDGIWKEFNAPDPIKENIIWYYEAVLGVLKARLKSPIVEELEKIYKVFRKTL
jgi:(p)ppGpp synthase/HD superfamily hydrolase